MPLVFWFGDAAQARARAYETASKTRAKAVTPLGRAQASVGLRWRLRRAYKKYLMPTPRG
jgi:hypothetical protein